MKAVAAFLLVLCYLAVSVAEWNCEEAPQINRAFQIDSGHGKVVVRDTSYYSYILIGSSWQRLSTTRLKHVSVGPAGLWGADTANRVYKYIADNFVRSSGLSLMQVDAGGDDQVVGVTTSWYVYCLRNNSALEYYRQGSLRWTSLSRRLKYFSCSPVNGCWGVDTSSRIYYIQTVNPGTCSFSSPVLVSGLSLKMIEVGTDGKVFGVTTSGRVYQRDGISTTYPQGRSWVQIPMCMAIRHTSWDLGRLWVVTNSGLIMYCTP